MFSKDITENDAFLEMPLSSQALYFHLGMQADDDGFVSPNRIMRMIGCQSDDLKILITKKFVLSFPDGVVVIKHWKINNYLRPDRYKETTYIDKKELLTLKNNDSYTWSTIGIPDDIPQVDAGKDRIGKDRIGKVSIDTPQFSFFGEYKKVKLTESQFANLTESLGESPVNVLIIELDQYIASKGKDPYKDHSAVIKQWYRRKLQDHASKFIPGKPKMI